MATNRTALKCLKCGLHFNVYSWDEHWAQGQHFRACPECGSNPAFVLGEFKEDGEIFEHVPGYSRDPEWQAQIEQLRKGNDAS